MCVCACARMCVCVCVCVCVSACVYMFILQFISPPPLSVGELGQSTILSRFGW